MFTKEDVAKTIDHAVLKPFATDQDIIEGAKMCDEGPRQKLSRLSSLSKTAPQSLIW